MKSESFRTRPLNILNSERSSQSHSQSESKARSRLKSNHHIPFENLSASLLTSENLRRSYDNSPKRHSLGSTASTTGRGKRIKSRIIPMKSSSKGISKKPKTMDYTNYAYNEAVGRLKLMLAESYTTPKTSGSSYVRSINDDSTDNCSDTISVIERPVFADISKYLSPGYRNRMLLQTSCRPKKLFGPTISSSSYKHNLPTAKLPPLAPGDSVQTPGEIFNFIEKQEDYIEQLEKESHYCRSELSQLLGKVKEVINENEQLTEQARCEFAAISGVCKNTPSPSSDSEDTQQYLVSRKKITTSRSLPTAQDREKKNDFVKSPRYANAPSIVYESRISELEAELMQTQIDLKRLQAENEELKRQLAHVDPVVAITGSGSRINACEAHHKQIEQMQQERHALEETIRQLQKLLDEAKSNQYSQSSKRYVHDLLQMERSQAELEVKHLRDELDRQHERVRELQHEMARRLADERASAERRYNNQVDQLGGDLSSQWEQVTKLQLEQERQKRYEADLKRELAQRNAQIDDLKMELKSNRTTFLADMAQVNAERQSLEQEITALRLQLDRSAREAKTEATRLNAEINSLRQRLDRGDADLLHSKREVLRLNDEIANLEKELAYGELKNEIRPTKKDLDKRITEIQDKHAETVNELEEMIQNQKQLMDKLTNECKILTNKLEEATLKNNQEKQQLRDINEKLMQRLKQIWASYKELNARYDERSQSPLYEGNSVGSDVEPHRKEHFTPGAVDTLAKSNVEYLTNRMLNNDRPGKLDSNPTSYNSLPPVKASLDHKPSKFGAAADDYKSSPYSYESILGKSSASELLPTTKAPNTATEVSKEPLTGNYDFNKSKYESNAAATKTNASKIGYSKVGYQDDDENLKDKVGVGEKQQQRTEPDINNASKSAYNPNGVYNIDYGGTSEPQTNDVNDYSNDYSAYAEYDQQQYDPSAYDPSYEQQQYDGQQQQQQQQQLEYGNREYSNGQQNDYEGYDVADYEQQQQHQQSTYQYDAAFEHSTDTATINSNSTSTKAMPSATPNESLGLPTNAASRTTAESRIQSRTSSSVVGSAAAGGGGISGNKSSLPQQSPAAAAKK